jgi:hypothetical protein
MTNGDICGPQAHTAPIGARIRAGHLLVLLRRNQVPCSIDSFSTSGWTARLGDPAKGPYSQQGFFPTREAAAEWLLGELERRSGVASRRPEPSDRRREHVAD